MKWNLNILKFVRVFLLAGVFVAACTFYSCSGKLTGGEELLVEQEETSVSQDQKETSLEEETEESGKTVCFVHVCGQVSRPGLYQMEEGSRIWDAVELAGGFLESADSQYLNLAQPVTDGMQILVPTVEQALEWHADARGEEAKSGGAGGKVNLNTADKEELMTLKGVGESKAEDIIQYRETQGPFEKIEDIMNISGIKDALFQKIKDSITV